MTWIFLGSAGIGLPCQRSIMEPGRWAPLSDLVSAAPTLRACDMSPAAPARYTHTLGSTVPAGGSVATMVPCKSISQPPIGATCDPILRTCRHHEDLAATMRRTLTETPSDRSARHMSPVSKSHCSGARSSSVKLAPIRAARSSELAVELMLDCAFSCAIHGRSS